MHAMTLRNCLDIVNSFIQHAGGSSLPRTPGPLTDNITVLKLIFLLDQGRGPRVFATNPRGPRLRETPTTSPPSTKTRSWPSPSRGSHLPPSRTHEAAAAATTRTPQWPWATTRTGARWTGAKKTREGERLLGGGDWRRKAARGRRWSRWQDQAAGGRRLSRWQDQSARPRMVGLASRTTCQTTWFTCFSSRRANGSHWSRYERTVWTR